ncbi:MAG TPA: FtsH protease activity modulator HflK [Steroidobacteraceae bacterium]|nr:FtsH protease activity modulator HflK [Steroidobacteraceae bacterium]
MAWNEPGGNSGGKRNPWGGNKPDQGPPDLDEVLRNLQRRIAGFFGRGGGGRGPGGSSAARGFGIGTIVAILLAIWAFTGLYQVDAAERGVVLRFGRHVGTTMPGLRWHLPWPIETKQIVNVANIQSFSDQTRMLTSDENLVDINLEVQYRFANPLDYAFNVLQPEETLKGVSESAIREVIGRSKLDDVLESGRQEIVTRTKELVQRTLDAYKTGIEVTTVNLQDVRVPTEVGSAQADAIKAREDRDRLSLQAQAYSNDLIPRARGQAVRQVQDAKAYRASTIANAEGEAQRFTQLLEQYERSPGVTRDRLYLETLEQVLASSKKIVIDSKGSGNVLYLPIDKLMEQSRRDGNPSDGSVRIEPSGPDETTTVTGDRRSRGAR